MSTLITQHELATYLFALTKYGSNKTDDKKAKLRDILVEEQKSQIDLCLNGSVDGEIINEKCITGILSVGKNIKDKAPSHTPEIAKIIGILLENLDRKERDKLLKKFAIDAPSLFAKSNPLYESLASDLMSSVRSHDSYKSDSRGAVSFKFVEKIE